ncbi:hypothetical protein NQ317_018948 [Molorchus minor]|uniref:DAGKc domain-containing protein n=1 Tax=Molorchus minor TaxID=1323400 RepID=A0ABQ9IQW5_9CUCU|nr:hypothetical protein NQ317_018948 [Molorchus minor]
MEIKVDNLNQTLLEETFYVLSKKNCVFRVRLTRNGLCLVKESEKNIKEQIIPIRDIVGCRCLRSKKQPKGCTCQSIPHSSSLEVVEDTSGELDDSDISAYLYVYAYIFQISKSSHKRRERTIITLRFRSFDRYEDNHKEAQKWRMYIKKLIKGDNVANILPITSNNQKEDKRLLILCNPKSGAGKGKQIFQQKVVPILQEAEISYDLHMTKHANFARGILEWHCGVINGIFERWDWKEAIKSVPIGVIPGGSGNGLARSIAHHCSEPYLPSPTLPSALAAVRNNFAPMDLVRVETTPQIMFSFLSVGWGLLSDIDIESERLRMLGGQRFTVWSVARLIGLRSYGGKLWYLPTDVPLTIPKEHFSYQSNPGSNLDLPAEVHLETQTGRERVDSWYSANSRKSMYFSATGSSYQSTTDSLIGDSSHGRDRPVVHGPASQIPCLTAPLPTSWKCISGRFVMVHASYQSHLGEDCLFAPEARLNDGKIWLLIVRAGATRSQLLHFLLGLSTGAHASTQTEAPIELIPVNAFRIEPDMTESGYMTVDGEHVQYGCIQAEIFPELGRVMVP